MRGMAFEPTARPRAARGAEAANRYATTSLVLGIVSFALIPASVLVLWVVLRDVQLDTWTVILYLISVVTAICAGIYGAKGRRLAKDSAVRVRATIGVVLSISFFVVMVVGFVLLMIIASIVASHDSL